MKSNIIVFPQPKQAPRSTQIHPLDALAVGVAIGFSIIGLASLCEVKLEPEKKKLIILACAEAALKPPEGK